TATATVGTTERLPRANTRDPGNPFPAGQYIRVPNVAVFSEHETSTPEGNPQRFDRDALQRLIERGNERIRTSGDYAAVCIGHTHDPDDAIQEQPEVIGAMGPYRLGLLGHPGQRQKYAILADLWIRRDKIDKYNAHPRRSVELWYEHDQPAWIDPLSLLTEAPRLDLGLTPLIDAAGSDGADAGLKYLYAATATGGLRRVKYAAAAPACGNVFVPAEGGQERYSAEFPEPQPTEKEALMLAPEDIRQIVDAIESLDWVQGVKEMLATQSASNASIPPAEAAPELGGEPAVPESPAATGDIPPSEPPAPPVTPPAAPPPTEPAPELPKTPDDDSQGPAKFSADAATTGDTKEKTPAGTRLEDMGEEEIEKYLCDLRKKKYAAEGSVDGKGSDAPATASVDPGQGTPAEGSASGESQTADNAKYSALEAKLAELEADSIKRTDEARKAKLTQLRYHRAFDLDKEVERCRYSKMSDDQFASHCGIIADNFIPTLVNQAMPVPDELLDSKQPAAATRPGPERYTKEAADKAVQYVVDQANLGKAVSYETVLEKVVNGQPLE
ncbi:MAG: hypothetical protein PHU85_15580, partial [Phycisphaerae bacterium]|nr:hypothetical protein [Phycisphaerae bacterium]